jgi:hypothetical protein
MGQTFARQHGEAGLLEAITRSARILFDLKTPSCCWRIPPATRCTAWPPATTSSGWPNSSSR